MSLTLKSSDSPKTQREFRYTRQLYHALDDSGLFDGTKVELIRGRLIEMPPMSDKHGMAAMCGMEELRRIFAQPEHTVRSGLPFVAVDDSEPEPDLCVVVGPYRSLSTHPSSCLLLIEISLSTLAFDRTEKASLYAESGVADYWIINLIDRVVEVYRDPARRDDGTWGYEAPIVRRVGEMCMPLAAPDATIAVADLLPV